MLAVRAKKDRFIESPLLPDKKADLAEEIKKSAPTLPLPTAEGVRNRALQALDQYKKNKTLPPDFVWSTHFIDTETLSRVPTTAELDSKSYSHALSQFKSDTAKYAEDLLPEQNKETSPLQALIADLFGDYLKHYKPGSSEMRSFLERGTGDETAQTRLVLSAFQATEVKIPTYLRLAVEVDAKDQSIQPVLLHKETGEVTQLITGKKTPEGPRLRSGVSLKRRALSPKGGDWPHGPRLFTARLTEARNSQKNRRRKKEGRRARRSRPGSRKEG